MLRELKVITITGVQWESLKMFSQGSSFVPFQGRRLKNITVKVPYENPLNIAVEWWSLYSTRNKQGFQLCSHLLYSQNITTCQKEKIQFQNFKSP